MADLNRDVNEEIDEERVAQEAAHPTQPLDSTTLFTARLPGIRDTAEEAPNSNLKDTNQALDVVLPD